MYLHKIAIRNIRSIRNFEMTFLPHEFSGWHVLLGDNGAGKSTVVRAIALALAGPAEAPALRQNWKEWLTVDQDSGLCQLYVDHDPTIDKAAGKGKSIQHYYINATITLDRTSDGAVTLNGPPKSSKAYRYLWGGKPGWFSASYGPFRRFAGGDKNFEKLFYSSPRLAPHLSAFGEDVALTEVLEWIKQLQFRSLELHEDEAFILESIKAIINQGDFLPHDTILDNVSSDGVTFRDGNGSKVLINQLSDGYRSLLSMTLELLRQMITTYGSDKVFSRVKAGRNAINLPGVVIIDEIDAHLHPTWQKRIGTWLRRVFPKIQFIVTTHSPLICQAATEGSIWKLPTPGDDESGGRVTGTNLDRLLYGDLVEAYDTELFGIGSTRSEVGKDKLEQLALLNVKSRLGKLSAAEKEELERLRGVLASVSSLAKEAKE